MSYDIPDLVETSTNLASVSFKDRNALIHLSTRSSIKSALQDLRDKINATAMLSGAKVTEDTPYPGWKPDMDSSILALSKKIPYAIYYKIENEIVQVVAILPMRRDPVWIEREIGKRS